MPKRPCAIAFVLTCFLSNVAIAGQSKNTPLLMANAIAVHAHQLSENARATGTGAMGSQSRQCRSKKKGAILGAVIGAAAGGLFALRIVGSASGVPGVAQGAARYVTYWMIGGAGVGALSGIAYCTT